MPRLRHLAALLLGLVLATGTAGASAGAATGDAGSAGAGRHGGLEDDEQLTGTLVAVAVADKIRRECDDIAPRLFRALRLADQLKAQARARGHSPEQIDAFINDRAQKARIRALRDAYLKSKGVRDDDPRSLCALGHAEIAANSLIGYLLKAK